MGNVFGNSKALSMCIWANLTLVIFLGNDFMVLFQVISLRINISRVKPFSYIPGIWHSPWKMIFVCHPKRKGSSSNHQFSGGGAVKFPASRWFHRRNFLYSSNDLPPIRRAQHKLVPFWPCSRHLLWGYGIIFWRFSDFGPMTRHSLFLFKRIPKKAV